MPSINPSRLRAAREAQGLRREEVAVRLGISYPSVIAYETGAGDPSLRVLVRLADLYKVPVGDLFPAESAGAR